MKIGEIVETLIRIRDWYKLNETEREALADVQKVRHGKYIGEQQYGDCVMQHCEQCGYLVYVDDYCGHCGTKMDGE